MQAASLAAEAGPLRSSAAGRYRSALAQPAEVVALAAAACRTPVAELVLLPEDLVAASGNRRGGLRLVGSADLHLAGEVVGELRVYDIEEHDTDLINGLLARIAGQLDTEVELRLQTRQPFPAGVDQDEVVSAISHEIR